MIITCPDCETQYIVNAVDIAPDGRDVKCSRCDYQWYVAPVIEEAGSAGIPPMDPIAGTPQQGAVEQPAPSQGSSEGQSDANPDSSASDQDGDEQSYIPELEDDEEAPPHPEPAIAANNQLPVPVEQIGPGPRTGMAFLLIAGLAFAGFGFVAEQQRVTEAWPAARHLYAAAGLSAPIARPMIDQPVELRDVRVGMIDNDPNGGVLVSGVIYGPLSEVRAARLTLIIEDANGTTLVERIIDHAVLEEQADGVHFAYQMSPLPDGAHGVIVAIN